MKYSQNTQSFEEQYKAFRKKNKPVNEKLWENIQDLAWGNKKKMEYGGKEITAPNDGKGFRYSPSFAKSWAVETYNDLDGEWKEKEKKNLAEDEVFQEAIRKNVVEENEVEFDREAMMELVGNDPFLHSLLEALNSEFDDGLQALFESYVKEDDQVKEVYKQILD